VEDITEAELQNICHNVREKVYNSSTVGSLFALLLKTFEKRLNVKLTEKQRFFKICFSRDPLVTSAARRQLTPKQTAVIQSVWG